MSDFDKEAAREELREKYERDQEKREATQQMSELLLQGATMTNRHCDTCGDPIFRYDGEEFCPTCSGEAQQEAGTPDQQTEVETAETSLDVEPPAEGELPAQPQQAEQQGQQTAADHQQGQQSTAGGQSSGERHPAARQQGGQSQPRSQQRADQSAGSGSTMAGEGRDALESALTNAARNAENATDPRTATAWLEAAREAAEAIATLDGR